MSVDISGETDALFFHKTGSAFYQKKDILTRSHLQNKWSNDIILSIESELENSWTFKFFLDIMDVFL